MAELLGQNLQYASEYHKGSAFGRRNPSVNIYRAILAYQYNERIQF